MTVRYRVDLSEAERSELHALTGGGRQAVRKVKRAQILLAADAGHSDEAIAATVAVGTATVHRTRRRFVEGNLEAALGELPRPGAPRTRGLALDLRKPLSSAAWRSIPSAECRQARGAPSSRWA